jgi:hypothetical protein
MQRISERGISEKTAPEKRVFGNENFKKKTPAEEREVKAREEVISGDAFR